MPNRVQNWKDIHNRWFLCITLWCRILSGGYLYNHLDSQNFCGWNWWSHFPISFFQDCSYNCVLIHNNNHYFVIIANNIVQYCTISLETFIFSLFYHFTKARILWAYWQWGISGCVARYVRSCIRRENAEDDLLLKPWKVRNTAMKTADFNWQRSPICPIANKPTKFLLL